MMVAARRMFRRVLVAHYRRDGFALMVALWLIVVLTSIAAAVSLGTHDTTALAATSRARVSGVYAAESGVTIAVSEVDAQLAALGDSVTRRRYLNHLDAALGTRGQMALGDARYAVALVDVSARLDVNNATETALTRFFSSFAPANEAAAAARAIREWIGGEDVTGIAGPQSAMQRGATVGTRQAARLLQSLDELDGIPGMPPTLARAAAPWMTVDGDGRINRATASGMVLAAAGGELQDEPSRLLVISRGWLDGHPLTHEIQAVFAIEGNRLALVRWRERDL
jgi:general secretion pathway protein K